LKNNPLLILVLFSLGLSDEARFDLFPQTIRVALDVDRCRVMEDPVKDGRGDDRIAENLVPLAEAAVGGQDERPLFIAPGDELEEKVRPVTVDRDIADLVDLCGAPHKSTNGKTAVMWSRSRNSL
jgi:hypothetical protein